MAKAKGRDFYGQEVTALIGEACREFGVSQEELDIEVLETGSAGIFGLCRKKAHIRVRLKPIAKKKGANRPDPKPEETKPSVSTKSSKHDDDDIPASGDVEHASKEKKQAGSQPDEGGAQEKSTASASASEQQREESSKQQAGPESDSKAQAGKGKKSGERRGRKQSQEPVQPPSEEVMARVKADICELLELMGYPSEVNLQVEDAALRCQIKGEHEEAVVGSEGRTLDSMQYLLRKMMAGVLPDRMMLSLDAGDFRRRRAEELKERALALAEEVRETGKTQAIPALNPAERREVHMILQEDKTIRSRSVGDGLFKKVLIYKPGSKSGRSSRKRKRRSSGRSKEN